MRARPWSPPELDRGATVYHYTTPDGLVGMMTQRVLWATEVGGLNDLSEITAGRKLIHDRARWLQHRMRRHGSSDSRFDALLAATAAQPDDRPPLRTYVLCASLEQDDAAQWRLYGGRRAGYAVHIDTSIPLQVVSSAPPVGEVDAFFFPDTVSVARWYRVCYTDEEKVHLLRSLFEWVSTRYSELVDEIVTATDEESRDHNEQADDAYTEDVRAACDLAAALIKPPGFSGEREVRAIAVADRPDLHASFRGGEHGVVQHLRLAAARDGRSHRRVMEDRTIDGHPDRTLPITGVTIGPNPHAATSIETVELLCERGALPRKGVDSRVVLSRVPLRW